MDLLWEAFIDQDFKKASMGVILIGLLHYISMVSYILSTGLFYFECCIKQNAVISQLKNQYFQIINPNDTFNTKPINSDGVSKYDLLMSNCFY